MAEHKLLLALENRSLSEEQEGRREREKKRVKTAPFFFLGEIEDCGVEKEKIGSYGERILGDWKCFLGLCAAQVQPFYHRSFGN